MKKRLLCLMLAVGLLTVACGKQTPGTTFGDTVIISDALKEEGQASGTGETPEILEGSLKTEETAEPAATVAPVKQSYEKIYSKEKVSLYDTGTAVIGDAGYEIYNYVDSAADSYAHAVSMAGRLLGKRVNVYNMVVPTSVGITLPDNRVSKVGSSDQKKAIRKIEKKLSKSVTSISLYDVMMRHRTEYIYFRTDHHWTAKGAYYAYQQFCESTGRVPHQLSEYKTDSFRSFIGTFYNDSGKNKNLRKDTMKVYYPLSRKVSMKYKNEDGKMRSGEVIEDATHYGISLKYCAFIGGDNPYTVIQNKEKKDGSSCVVVKESFGNAMIPYLTDHYEKIYVIDYRYWDGSLSKLVKDKKVQDVLFVNNISMTRNTYLIGKLSQIIK